jgi:ABC-type amino acid transport substrate-binding protein
MLPPRWRQLLLIAALAQPLCAMGATVIYYPRPESGPNEPARYAQKLLEQVLKRAGGHYRVERYLVRMHQVRAIEHLKSGEGIDVLNTMTSIAREQEMLPVRIPIDKGLIGWRLMLIRQSQAATFRAITSLEDLKKLTAGQGKDWPDTQVLNAGGLRVYGTSDYMSLFKLLENGRIDYFPRGVTEAWADLELHPQNLMVEPTIALRYPTAIYFFVRKGNTRLAADITAGLEKMIADGSFEKLFQEYYGATIRRARFKDRRIFELPNPVMPPGMPLARKNLWYRE